MDIEVERVFQAVTERLRRADRIPKVEPVAIAGV
jgi:hypothetical protein